ncbi:MAG: hypothetical protein Q7L55_09560 [Actinomycetota bacterium]|nr:hypothetical protein [Actinomycetota bacterium]
MTELACILAAPDLALEPELVAQSSAFGLRIVRRSLDAADLMAAAALEPHLAIVVTCALPRLTRDLIARLCADRLVLGLAPDPQSAQQLHAWGVADVVDVRSSGQTIADLCSALNGVPRVHQRTEQHGVWSTGAWAPMSAAQFVRVPSAASSPMPVQTRG